MHNIENYNGYQTEENDTKWEGIDNMQTTNNDSKGEQAQTTPDMNDNESLTQGQREFLKERMRETIAEGYKNDGRLPQEYYDLTKKVLDKMESGDKNQ